MTAQAAAIPDYSIVVPVFDEGGAAPALAREIATAAGKPGFLVVTPGVRPFWSAKNDQARAATPAQAIASGATHIVCGRPITAANDPREAALKVIAEMAEA